MLPGLERRRHHDWSTAAQGGNGSPGLARVDFLMFAPQGVKVYEITDATNNVPQNSNQGNGK